MAPRLDDKLLAVRIEAARALAGVDPQTLSPAQRTALDRALAELAEKDQRRAV